MAHKNSAMLPGPWILKKAYLMDDTEREGMQLAKIAPRAMRDAKIQA
jgi:hypothetical protein